MAEITVYKRRLLGETKLSRNSQKCLHEGIGEQTRGTMSFELNGASQTSSITSRTKRAEGEKWIQPETTHRARMCRIHHLECRWDAKDLAGDCAIEQVPRREDHGACRSCPGRVRCEDAGTDAQADMQLLDDDHGEIGERLREGLEGKQNSACVHFFQRG